ncbi:MAG: pyridoxamine 5'-phosphate oxidase family protein [Anaerolineae bacterium]|nr:pyridoxamine 5'-phosphate oxidase family protein [Anaerolineae bacterium]MEB2287899.1 pyridoxamine 5'-phosphate oxidase family protein [Anaerolineae bacterium]
MGKPPPLPDEMRPLLRNFLGGQSTLALATAGLNDGRPQAAPLFFASDDTFNLYWVSDPDSRHSRNLEDWSDVAATVYVHTWDWADIKGVQIEGAAMPVTDDEERQRALAVYSAKFPFVNERFSDLIAASVFYVLRPRWLRWIDNERRFGYQQEFTLSGDSEPASDDTQPLSS